MLLQNGSLRVASPGGCRCGWGRGGDVGLYLYCNFSVRHEIFYFFLV